MTPFKLLIDDNNGPLDALEVPTNLVTTLTAGPAASSAFGPFVTYRYAITGTIDFTDASNILLMRISINSGANAALMTVSGSATEWGSGGAIIGSDSFTQVEYTITPAGFAAFNAAAILEGSSIASYGIPAAGPSFGQDDFGFTLTALLQRDASTPVTVNEDKMPSVAWQAESSYSGSANFVPAPGAAGLIACAGLLAVRRRRI